MPTARFQNRHLRDGVAALLTLLTVACGRAPAPQVAELPGVPFELDIQAALGDCKEGRGRAFSGVVKVDGQVLATNLDFGVHRLKAPAGMRTVTVYDPLFGSWRERIALVDGGPQSKWVVPITGSVVFTSPIVFSEPTFVDRGDIWTQTVSEIDGAPVDLSGYATGGLSVRVRGELIDSGMPVWPTGRPGEIQIDPSFFRHSGMSEGELTVSLLMADGVMLETKAPAGFPVASVVPTPPGGQPAE